VAPPTLVLCLTSGCQRGQRSILKEKSPPEPIREAQEDFLLYGWTITRIGSGRDGPTCWPFDQLARRQELVRQTPSVKADGVGIDTGIDPTSVFVFDLSRVRRLGDPDFRPGIAQFDETAEWKLNHGFPFRVCTRLNVPGVRITFVI